MKVLKEVEISDSEVYEVIVKGMYWKEHEDFYIYNLNYTIFPDFESWKKDKYIQMQKHFKAG